MHSLVDSAYLCGEYGKLSRVIQNIILLCREYYLFFLCSVAVGFKPHFYLKYYFSYLQCVRVSFGDVLVISRISYRITFLWRFPSLHFCLP